MSGDSATNLLTGDKAATFGAASYQCLSAVGLEPSEVLRKRVGTLQKQTRPQP